MFINIICNLDKKLNKYSQGKASVSLLTDCLYLYNYNAIL